MAGEMGTNPGKEQAINQALNRIDGIQKFLGRREIKELPSILWEDEVPERVITGTYNNGNGILVATDRRLMFVDKGVFSFKMEDFAYDKITSIESKTGMMFGGITIYASGNKEEIANVDKESTRSFADYLRAKISRPNAQSSVQQSSVETPTATVSVADELEKLAGLLERGILTQEEFSEQKSKLLG